MILLLLCNYTIYAQVMRISGRSYKDDQVMYESTFGGIPALTNGLVGRTENGDIKNRFLISNNAGFFEYGFDTNYNPKVPSGTYAFWAEKYYDTENGSIIRLDGASGGKYKIYVQDNLTAIGKIAVTMHGHKVID